MRSVVGLRETILVGRRYNMTPSTTFKGTKLVVPNDAAGFFADLFDLGLEMTNGRFNTYEIDFLDNNFQGTYKHTWIVCVHVCVCVCVCVRAVAGVHATAQSTASLRLQLVMLLIGTPCGG